MWGGKRCHHGKMKRYCSACKTARAGQLDIKQEPEVRQEQFTIQGYFGFDK
jgi:hypothetical protein